MQLLALLFIIGLNLFNEFISIDYVRTRTRFYLGISKYWRGDCVCLVFRGMEKLVMIPHPREYIAIPPREGGER